MACSFLYSRSVLLCYNKIGQKFRYPDFTILNIHTGKITYWEHAGRMDDPNYANDFVRKVNVYIYNNLLPGRDVVFTYESSAYPLEIRVIKKQADSLTEM